MQSRLDTIDRGSFLCVLVGSFRCLLPSHFAGEDTWVQGLGRKENPKALVCACYRAGGSIRWRQEESQQLSSFLPPVGLHPSNSPGIICGVILYCKTGIFLMQTSCNSYLSDLSHLRGQSLIVMDLTIELSTVLGRKLML